ncbi:cellulose synthase-like protein G3, partial [Ananas comosus]|uniref:Cellulose synthase-like protein G3 n=1 Tax=Ananas comosus TaxID=4615 RepID=A0A6P5EEF9_ANACO
MRSHSNPKSKAEAEAEAEAVHDHDQPLSSCHVDQPAATLNRVHTLLHLCATLLLLRARASSLRSCGGSPLAIFASSLLLLAADAVLAFLWALGQAFRWRPVTRAVYPDRLSKAAVTLPAVDVFVVTADPEKEPAVK